ncbi:Protein kinase-like domain [Pseudocohnilembus persalinus]|uniref:Protein kinase-like domain n=1 Tax=Pseudocohnilembus persalinus TaxID=266149 RepID=A0A0V0R4P3_PSEPJ|nr:Protein kinase-like domain [Pseudocohnilembus persalinus]|eukprot:KRX09452.1 Protein kinase-like domain [Pseudocohnilembus persalinus]
MKQNKNFNLRTFVGSPQYVSPELLQTNLSGPEADLWALGCIIYKMFTNDTPFMSGNEYLIFQLVKKGDYKIPSNIPPEAVDLIQKLLNLDPKQRLGAGKQGSVNDYRALKSHPFFKGINWEKLFSQEAPHRPVQYGANNISKLGDSDDDENQTQNSGWGNPNKKPILQGIVSKKVGFFIYKKRNMLLLPNPPTLLYYETDGDQKKLGEIKLQKEIKAQLHDNNSFTIGGVSKKGKTKTLYFKGAENATLWVTKINDLVQTVQ